MSQHRPVLLRTVGSLTLAGLLALNGWLLLLNLAKHDRLPDGFDRVPGVAAAVEAGAEGDDIAGGVVDDPGAGDEAEAGLVVGSGDAAPFNAEGADVVAGTGPSGTIEVDRWPGGRGPAPDGPPVGRQIRVAADGQLRLTGSAPSWSVVNAVVDDVAARLGLEPTMIVVDVSWHPAASPRVGDGEVVLEEPLVYRPGQIDLPDGGADSLTPVIRLLGEHPEFYVVVAALIDGDGVSDEESAVALGRTSVIADAFVGSGIDADRVVTSVSPIDVDGGPDQGADRVVVRLENLLVVGATG